VGLVNGDEGQRSFAQHIGETGDAQALRRDEEELQLTAEVIQAGLARLGARAAGVDALDGNPVP